MAHMGTGHMSLSCPASFRRVMISSKVATVTLSWPHGLCFRLLPFKIVQKAAAYQAKFSNKMGNPGVPHVSGYPCKTT